MSGRPAIVGEAGRAMQSAPGVLAVALLALAGCESRTAAVAPPPPLTQGELDQRIDRLEAAVIARLMLMPEVARAKFAAHQPIHDPQREAAVTEEFLTLTRQKRVPGLLAENVIAGQLRASREWQQALIDDWTQSPPAEEPVRDLATELRPEINRATTELAASLAAFPSHDTRWLTYLRSRVVTAAHRPAAMPERIWWLAWEPFVGPRTPVPNRRITVQRDPEEVLPRNTRKARKVRSEAVAIQWSHAHCGVPECRPRNVLQSVPSFS